MRRTPQLRRPVDLADPLADYYNDLRVVALAHGSPERAAAAFAAMTDQRTTANPVSVAQLGLASFQLRNTNSGWLDIAVRCASWLASELGRDGVIEYQFAFRHTYPLAAPWGSAMAQGQVASLLLRIGQTQSGFSADAVRAIEPLVSGVRGLSAETLEGPVLQEYPTMPPAHVLNGWIFALWGLYDVSVADGVASEAAQRADDAFRRGAATLAKRLPLYEVAGRWSRYDLYPHPLVHVASPFYHRLHCEQLAVLAELASEPVFSHYAERWARSSSNFVSIGSAVMRKGLFRVIRPRKTS